MPAKPQGIEAPTLHVKWDPESEFRCPACNRKLMHLYNDGGRKQETMKGPLWVVTNFYKCPNPACDFNKAFSPVQASVLKRKQFNLDVWAKVIQHHYKHRLDYKTISEIMWDDWEVSISPGTVQAVCESFEVASKPRIEEEVKAAVQERGRIVLRLDGVQPEKGRPAFWMFYDNVGGDFLFGQELEKASWQRLVEIFTQIENEYGVEITGGVSDKQANIVKAFEQFRPGIPHAYCQFHFLDHVAEPMATKDSHLLTQLRAEVRDISIVSSHVADQVRPVAKDGRVGDVLAPLVEELKCAVATTGDCIKTFPGVEAFANLEYLLSRLQALVITEIPARVKRSFNALVDSIETILNKYREIYQDTCTMLFDFDHLRCILGHKQWSSAKVKKAVDKWVYMLQCRLKRRQLENNPALLKWVQASPVMELGEAWQQWIRLVHSYESGLYLAYDNPDLTFTNNDTESKIHQLKYQFKKWLGRSDIQNTFEVHAENYARLLDFDFTTEKISEILLASEIAVVNEMRQELHARYATTKRSWRIREKDTGNLEALKQNLVAASG